MGRRAFAAVVAALAVSATLVACGDDDDDGGGGGDGIDAGSLVIYSGRQEALVGPLIDRFEQETGIETSVRYGNTAQLAAQLIEEGDRTPADVFFSQDGGALGALHKRDLLAPIPQPVLDRVPAKYRDPDGTWVGTSGRARVIVYDPSQVAEADVPTDIYQLTDPKWRGRVGIAPSNASFQAFVTALRVLDGEDKAKEWLEGMVDNAVQTFDNNILILNAAEDGVVALGLINHYYWYEQVAEEGIEKVPARLKFLPGGAGALVNVGGLAVLKGSDHSEQAQRFTEFLLGEEAQKFFAEQTKEYPLVPGVPAVADLPPLESLQSPDIDLSDLDTLDKTLELLEDVGLS